MIAITLLILIPALLIATIYFWPLKSKQLQTSTPETVSYQQAMDRFAAQKKREIERKVITECKSRLLTHGNKAAKTVVMFHGVTACPKQYDGLAKVFFDAGYNVYVPRAPYHGTPDKNDHGQITSANLIAYVNDSITTATGLGDELGVVGLSGGGMLATWAAEYRPEVTRLLTLSPFYEPAAAQAPKWQLPFLHVLYGLHIIPDKFIEPATPKDASFSYRALANYDIVTKNLKANPTGLNLQSVALVISDSDDQIDLNLANSIPQKIAEANNLSLIKTHLPADWNAKHDIVSLANDAIVARQAELFQLYLNSYEGKR